MKKLANYLEKGKRNIRKAFELITLVATTLLPSNLSRGETPKTIDYSEQPPKNVILMIGDGMGKEHIRAAGMYLNGNSGTLSFESFPYQSEMTTHSADNAITDSAASGTAMATGVKVNNLVVSKRIPGNGEDLETILENQKDLGKSTGLITTDSIVGATPATFGAHTNSRFNFAEIFSDYLTGSKPNVLFGGGGSSVSTQQAIGAGYQTVTNAEELGALDINQTYSAGMFGNGQMPYEYDGVGNLPHLSEMAIKSLEILSRNPLGYFAMIEGGNIDHAAHLNDIERDVYETVEFAKTVQQVYDWHLERNLLDKTLIVVTADHETGGLRIIRNNGKGNIPDVTWSTNWHTSTPVSVYGIGPRANLIEDVSDNTDIYELIKNSLVTSTLNWEKYE
ncbi:MAG: alkaline phosphatase [Nanoarchaeota archaeon]